MQDQPFATIALNRPLHQTFTYQVPKELRAALAVGKRVLIPFANKREVGVCVGVAPCSDVPQAKLKLVEKILDESPIITEELLELTRWLANYYVCAWGEALAAVLPPALKRANQEKLTIVVEAVAGAETELAELEKKYDKQYRLLRTLLSAQGSMNLSDLLKRTRLSMSPVHSLVKKELIHLTKQAQEYDPLLLEKVNKITPHPLNEGQKIASAELSKAIKAKSFAPFLLYGVTGSGKTEIYLNAIEETCAAGRAAIVLVPEISLTPQTVARFRARFDDIAVLHSRLTDNQRLAEWRRIRCGKVQIVIGARSAVFAPVQNLGLLVVDEEHEPSFKQQNTPRYNARDVAVYRASRNRAVVVLGSATPSLESYRNAQAGKYKLLSLPQRVQGGKLPLIHVVDMKAEVAEQKNYVVFSRILLQALQDALTKGEQGILFLNRRGFTPVIFCRQCGATLHCTRCDVSMTYHRQMRRLVCHTCCNEMPLPRDCRECGSPALLYLGAGAEKVEQRIKEIFPQARVARMDSDTMLRREDYEETLGKFKDGELDFLVGTQMIAKGLDFPNVTVVGVISADTSLHIPDFRASERTFQLISQVAGRAGRGPKGGVVVVQTSMPNQEAVRAALDHDYEGFVKRELEHRKRLMYPPFGRAVRIIIEGKDALRVQHSAQMIRKFLLQEPVKGLECLGPAAAPIAMLRNRHRWHILLKLSVLASWEELTRRLHALSAKSFSGIRVGIDVDPISVL